MLFLNNVHIISFAKHWRYLIIMKKNKFTICIILLFIAGCTAQDITKKYPVLKDLKRQGYEYENIKKVKNIKELIQALGSNTVIIVDTGRYVFTDSHILGNEEAKSKLDKFDTLSEHYDNTFIHDLENLVILGPGKPKPVFLQPDGYNHVMKLRNIKNLFMQNLSLGHEVGGYCVGGVIFIHNAENVRLDNMVLFGSGTEGLTLIDINNITVSNCLITKSTEQLSSFSNVHNAILDNCRFVENDPVLRGFSVFKSTVTFQNSLIKERYPFFADPQMYDYDYDVLFLIDNYDPADWYFNRDEKYQLSPDLPATEITFVNTVINDELINCKYQTIVDTEWTDDMYEEEYYEYYEMEE